MNPVNKKIAFLTFKIVEETIKRVCLKVQIEKLMPVGPETLRTIRKALNESNVQIMDKKLKSSLLMVPGMTKHQQESAKSMTQMNAGVKILIDDSAAASPVLKKDSSV